PGCARRRDVRHRADPHRRARLLLHAALPVVPRRGRALGARRPAGRGARDDGGAAARARDMRGSPAAPALAAAPHQSRHGMRPTAFVFEPLFLALAAAAAVLYWRAARRDPPSGWRLASFAAGLLLIAASLNSPLENLAAHYLLLVHLLQNALIADVA